jgi:hypothetical protein
MDYTFLQSQSATKNQLVVAESGPGPLTLPR